MQKQKLRVGLLLDSFQLPAWAYRALQYIQEGDSGALQLVVLNDDPGCNREPDHGAWVYSTFNRIDQKLFTKAPDPFAPRDSRELLAKVPVLNVEPVPVDGSCFLKGVDVRSIRDHEIDVLVKFGFEGLRCEVLNLSKYGIWYYYHGDDRSMRGGPPGFWEVVEKWPETTSALIASGGRFFPHRVLFRSHFLTYPLSPARNRSYFYWATTTFLARQIALLGRLGEEKYCQRTEKFNQMPLQEIKPYKVPSNLPAARSFAKITGRLAREPFRRAFQKEQWFLLFSLAPDASHDFGRFSKIMPPNGRFWADPHAVRSNGNYYLFVEEFLWARNKGHISVIEMDGSGNWKSPVKVLEESHHLSYPFIFNWQGEYFMVPESGDNRTIDLYRCVDFPYRWEFKQHLMKDLKAVDTTLTHHGDRWWMFTAIAENESAAPNVELFLFSADNPFSQQWTPHPQNPIVSDVKSARPAGDLFAKDGQLFRPSQDCSKAYGYGFDINEIEVLSETEYRERRVSSVRPLWDKKILATHTFSNQGDLTVIDALRRQPIF